jgi:hypothetical protein
VDESLLQQMIAESVRLGSGLADGERVVLDRARVLAEHGIARAEQARQVDEFVLRIGGSLRRACGAGGRFVWDLPLSALDAKPIRLAEAELTEGDAHTDPHAASG